MKYFLVTFEVGNEGKDEMFFNVLKSLNFTRQIMPNVWVTAGNGSYSDAKSIYDYLHRFAQPEDVIFVTQIATPVSMKTVHGNISSKKIAELLSA